MDVKIQIDKEWFDANKDSIIEKDSFDEDRPYYTVSYRDENHDRLVDNDGTLKISAFSDNTTLTVVDIKIEPESLINLAGLVSKYYNRAKTAFESLK